MFGLFKKKPLSFTAQKIMDSLSEERGWEISGTNGNPDFENGLYKFIKNGPGYSVLVIDQGRHLYIPLKNWEARAVYQRARSCWDRFKAKQVEQCRYEAVEIVHARAATASRPNQQQEPTE